MDCVIPVSDFERAAGALAPATTEAAYQALRQHGWALLRGAFTVAATDKLGAEFELQWPIKSESAAFEEAKRPPPNTVARVGEGRYEVLVKMTGAMGAAEIFGNPLLTAFLMRSLGENMKLSGATVVVSYPGAKLQHIHRDLHPLFEEPGISGCLPPYAINVAIPLVDVDQRLGPTGIWPGSHLWDGDRAGQLEEMHAVDFLRGDCVLTDYRTLHAGLPNIGESIRPILYLVYARTWVFDEANHQSRPSLDMPVEAFAALPAHLKKLASRTLSQHMRLRYFAVSTPGSDLDAPATPPTGANPA